MSKAPRACSYYRVDLHVHSPGSSDYAGDRQVSPYEFIREFVSRGLDLIAITDHNTGSYIDQAIEARNQIASKEGRNITVLPGVELHASPGVHLLAILPDGGTEAVTDLLSRLGLPSNQHGDNTKLISQPIGEISRIVCERRGLLIGAHCNSTKGVVEELSGQARLEWLRSLDALEINSESGEDKASKTIEYVTRDLKVAIPFTFGSDSHDSASDTTGMWVKMAEPSFTCLRQLTFEPQLRISRAEPAAPVHGWIAGFTTTHGIYAGERFRFSPHLNALLGGRGAGKSAAIDLLRFAFEAEPQASDENSAVFANRIMGFLRSVGEVCVLVIGTDGETYFITRDGTYEIPNARSRPIFTRSARVYQVSEDKLIERDLRPLDVLGIEFYGQGEVVRLADRVDEQLRLIDENLDHSVAGALVEAAEEQLLANEEQLLNYGQRLETIRAAAAARPQLEERRGNLAKSLEDPIFEERSRWDSERIWMERQEEWVKDILCGLSESIPPRPEDSIDIQESSAKAVLEKVKQAAVRIFDSGREDLASLRGSLADSLTELQGYRSEWNTEFQIAEERYRARLTELGATSLAQAAAEKSRVEQELTRIEISVEPEIGQIESEVASLQDQRSSLLEKLKSARSAIKQSRSQFVQELNSTMGGDVMVDLTGKSTFMYFDTIDGPLQGSRMLNRENQLSLVCETLTPERLVEVNSLERNLRIDENWCH